MASAFCGEQGIGPISQVSQLDLTPCFEESVVLLCAKAVFVAVALIQWPRGRRAVRATSWRLWLRLGAIAAFALAACFELAVRAAVFGGAWPGYAILGVASSLAVCAVAAAHSARCYLLTTPRAGADANLILWPLLAAGFALRVRTAAQWGDDMADAGDPWLVAAFAAQSSCAVLALCAEALPRPVASYTQLNMVEDEADAVSSSPDASDASPEEHANLYSRVAFHWLSPLLATGARRALTQADLAALPERNTSAVASASFERVWESSGRRSLFWSLVRAFGGAYALAGVFKLFQDVLAFTQVIMLEQLMGVVERLAAGTEDASDTQFGYLVAVGMFAAALTQSALLHQYFYLCLQTGIRVRAALTSAIYSKSLVLSSDARQTSSVGEIVNHMSIDAQKLQDMLSYAHILWSGPFQIGIALYMLYGTLGPSSFAGLATMLLTMPFSWWVAVRLARLQGQQMGHKDRRIKLMEEMLSGIKVLKLYAWERPFIARIADVRHAELANLRSAAYLDAFASFAWYCTPFLVSLASFATYSLLGNALTPDVAFVSLSLLNLLQFPLLMFPSVLGATVESRVSLRRLFRFLTADELQTDAVVRDEAAPTAPDAPLIEVEDGTFAWSAAPDAAAVLRHVNLSVRAGQLTAVIGRVGMGKSSLLSALLGDMVRRSGRARLSGRVAWVPQQAWIQNASLRDNILFGRRYDEARYRATLSACALLPDLAILPAGDATEIGEKGINLSGGQKQRVSLARAVYADADAYMLDDPLSAVDAHVAQHLFDKVIGPTGMLAGKARLLVTHAVQFLPRCDAVHAMEDGTLRVVAADEAVRLCGEALLRQPQAQGGGRDDDDGGDDGNKEEEKKKEGGNMVDSAESRSSTEALLGGVDGAASNKEEKAVRAVKDKAASDDDAAARDELIAAETVESGGVRASVYGTYFAAMSRGPLLTAVVVMILSEATHVGYSFWLSHWSDQEADEAASELALYLGVYAALGGLYTLLTMAQSVVTLVFCAINAARVMHERMLHRVLRAPMSFFDTTPTGRLVNRFSKDTNVIDETLPHALKDYAVQVLVVAGILVVIAVSTPIFTAVVPPLYALYYYIQKYYLASSRQLKRLDSVTRSPIFAHFGESLAGIATIRAFGRTAAFTQESARRVDANHRAFFPSIVANRWLATRLEALGASIVLFAGVSLMLSARSLDAAVAGLSLSYALSITGDLNWLVRCASEVETNIVAVERVDEYATRIPSERGTDSDGKAPLPSPPPPAEWPREGRVTLRDVSARYREGLDLCLRDVSLDIAAGEKVGVVGRTGAGKSSLALVLFRLIEPVDGSIAIDDVDVARLALSDLRARLSVIPQDPVLFSGTMRINLDPFGAHDDEALWRALECAHLAETVRAMPGQLDAVVAHGGENLSVGQRQLVCLARALLRRSHVLVLDEATAAVDRETDEAIQSAIRTEFAGATIIAIAHRLDTVMDADRIVVLDHGRVVEQGAPQALLAQPDSHFRKMARVAANHQ